MSEELKSALARIACLEGEIAKRDARIVELECELSDVDFARRVSLQNESDLAETLNQLRAELAAIKAQEPAFMWHKGATEDESEVVDVDCACPCCVPIYAAPVSEAKAQGVVMPERWNVPRPMWNDARQPYGNPLNHADIEAAEKFNLALDEVARLNAAPVQRVSVPDGFERYRLADKFCDQRLVTDDHVRAIVVDAFSSGYGFGIAASPAAPAADAGDIVLNASAQEILSQCIGAHAYVLGVLANGRPDLAFIEAKKWVDAFKKAATQMEPSHD